jgi:pimeloyl-ACP methyl ester carboxylesterase
MKGLAMFCKKLANARWIAIAVAIAAASASSDSEAAEAGSCAVADIGSAVVTIAEGKRFTVKVQGSGPDVILIPGLASSRAVWDESVKAHAGCYRLHVVQVRGFGDNAGVNADGPVLEPFVHELADYIDDEIVNKGRAAPAIIGHSLGGLSALMIGARYPQVADKIMVVDALPFIGTIFGAADVATVRPRAEAMATSIRAQYKADGPKAALTDCDNPAEAAKVKSIWSNTPRGRCIVENWGKLSDPRVTAQAMLDDTLTDMRPELSKIAAPVTLLYAQDDNVMPEAMARALFEGQYAGTPKFTPVMVKGSYHFIMIDQPAEFLAQVELFLKN